MALVLKDRVKETTTTVGLGTISLGGSSDTFEPFSTIGTGNTTYYAIVAEGNDNWEVGVGTVGSGTLSRDIVLASSNLNAKVNFPAGVKDVFVTLPANKIVSKDNATGINSGISLADYVDFDTTAAPATAVGRLFWNDQDGTLDLGLKGGSVTIHIGQKQVIRIVNKIGSSLSAANYQCVKISGAQGQRPKVALAQANNDANSADTIGLVNETIANNQEGFVCTGGTITNINTTGSLQGESWNDGDVLYLSGTVAGRITNVRPQAPINTVIVGFVIYAHNNQGKIYVKVDNGYELDELHNVRINGVTNGQVLTYNNGLWENQTNGSGTVTSVSGTGGYGGLTLTGTVTSSGNLTLGGTPTGTWPVSVSGNAATVTNGVYTTGDQTIGGNKNFSSTIIGSVSGNAGTVTNGVYITGDQTIGGAKTFSTAPNAPTLAVGTNNTSVATTEFVNAEIANDAPSKTGTGASGTWGISVTGNAGTVTNGVYTTGTQTITGNKTFTGSVTMGQSGGGEGGEILWLDPVQGTVCTDIPASGFFRVFQTSGTAKGAYIDLANCAGGVGSLLLHSTNYNSYAPTLTGGGASGSWGISVTGNAGTVTNGVYTTGDQTIGGVKTFTSSVDAPSFRDSANTAYYLDPASTGTAMSVAGNVGIGTTSPVTRLEVKGTGFVASSISGDSTSETQLRFNTNTGARISQQANQSLIFDTNATERMRITSAGNVGIGTTSPGRRLSIAGGGFAFDDANTSSRSIHWGDGTNYPLVIQGDVPNGFISFNTQASGSAPPERMRIDSAGNVGIGKTPDSGVRLDVAGGIGRISNAVSGNYGGDFRLVNSSAGATNPNKNFRISPTGTLELINSAYSSIPFSFFDDGRFYCGSTANAPSFYDSENSAYYLDPNNSGTALNVAGSIVAAGNVTAYSDIRVKDNVKNITDAIDKLNQIRGVTYTRTDLDDKERKYAGVIAQEIEQVLPEAVFDNGKVKAVDYNATIALLIEAIKEQQGQINELKLTIEQLKGN